MSPELLLTSVTIFAPFLGFLIIVLLTFKNSLVSQIISVSLMGLSAVASGALLLTHLSLAEPLTMSFTWLTLSHFSLSFGYLLDRLSLLMLFLVSFISFLIQVYSLGYMDTDPGKSRFFAYLSFFSGSMMSFVIAPNLVQAYVFWELFGLASYLLIGFWYEKPQAAAAAKKAFVMTRFGDVGFLIALVLLICQGQEAVQYYFLNSEAVKIAFSSHFIAIIGLLIFLGMMGKSSQFPLHTWLPDAMEGPTPVSALIHSATMVAAGVFLFARLHPFYSFSPSVLEIMLIIASITALIGATLACVQKDIKKIFAYSTISQLGLMMMALASGSYLGGVFHLTTHAFFKAMLFMCAGFLIHKFHTNDLYEIAESGGLKEKLLLVALATGSLALAGIYPLSGFFSKDIILSHLSHSSNFTFYIVASVVSLFTAFYSFKVLFVICLPQKLRLHETPLASSSKKAMLFSILTLAFITVTLGFLVTPFSGEFLTRFITYGESEPFHMRIALISTLVALSGASLSFVDFKISPWGKSKIFGIQPIRTLLERKYFIDDFYGWLVRTVLLGLGKTADWFDRNIIDGLVNGTGAFTVTLGRFFSNIQSGHLQNYLQITIWGLALFVIALTVIK